MLRPLSPAIWQRGDWCVILSQQSLPLQQLGIPPDMLVPLFLSQVAAVLLLQRVVEQGCKPHTGLFELNAHCCLCVSLVRVRQRKGWIVL